MTTLGNGGIPPVDWPISWPRREARRRGSDPPAPGRLADDVPEVGRRDHRRVLAPHPPAASASFLTNDVVGKAELSSPVIPPEPLKAYEFVRDIRLAAPDLVGDREATTVVIGRKPSGAALAHAGWRERGRLRIHYRVRRATADEAFHQRLTSRTGC